MSDGDPDERLTLGRLIQERLLRRVSPALPAVYAERLVTWCLPWVDAAVSTEDLAGVVLYARSGEFDAAARAEAAERGAVAVIIASAPEGARSAELSAEPPLLYAGAQVSFRDLSRLIADLALARETHVLRYGLNVHRSLVELLYRGAGLAALCHQMSRLANSAVAVLDPQLRVLAFEQGRSRVFEPGAVATALRALLGDTPIDPALTHARPEIRVLRMDEVALTCVLTPILLAGRHDGWVVVIESDEQPHPHDLAEHRVVVEQGATIIGTEMLRMRSVEQAEERARGDFVHALLHGRFATQHELEARATHYDFPVTGTFGVVVAGNVSTLGVDSLSVLFQLARDSTRLMPQPGMHTVATVVGDVLAVVREVGTGERTVNSGSRQLGEFAAVLRQELERRLRHPVAVTYGRPYRGAQRIFDSYREARLTLGLHARLKLTEICGFEDLRVYATLADLAASDGGRSYARDVLAPLRKARGAGADLEQAVVAYIASGGNINATARELHIHRNTMLYKLDRASRLLGLDLREAEQQFAVWLAYKLDLLFETARKVDRDVKPA